MITEKPEIAQELMKWLNTRRNLATTSELNSLNLSLTALTYLDETATIRAKELVNCYNVNRPDGRSGTSVIDKTRVGDTYMYEFIARGTDTTVEDIVDIWWKNSNFRSAGTTHFGCAVVCDEETGELFYCMHHVERGANPTGESAYTNRYSVRPYTASITLKCLEKGTDIDVSGVFVSLIRSVAHEYMANNIKVNGKYIVMGYTPKKNTDFTTEAQPSVIENVIGGDYTLKVSNGTSIGYRPFEVVNVFSVLPHGTSTYPEQTIELTPYAVTIESYGVDENSAQILVDGALYELTLLSDGTLENAVCDGTSVLISEKSVRFTANSVTSVKYQIPSGNYSLTELEPPEDHKKVQEITFTVDSWGNITDLSNAIFTADGTIKVVHSRNPPELHPLERTNVIKVYDISYKQENFGNGNNGLAILSPSECTSTKNADVWDISLVHPLDEWDKWKKLRPENVLEVRGQLFRIDEQTVECSENGDFMTVHARHISGDMADDLIENATFEGGTAQNFIDFAVSTAVMPFDEDYYEEHPDDYYHKPYVFTGYSDIETFLDGIDYTNTSLLGAIKGVDNCLINRYGGELYRNNFYFSVCESMENARDNAFIIRFSDVSGVSQYIDYSDFCTNLNCYDNFGNSFSVSYTGSSRDFIHHARRKMYKFNYKDESTAFTQLGIDCMALWEKISTPKVSYTVNFCSAKSDPRFTDFAVLQDFDYGDKGRIYCPELDIDTEQQIIEVVTNELTGEIISMKLGNVVDTLTRPNFLGSTITNGRGISDNLDSRISKLESANST